MNNLGKRFLALLAALTSVAAMSSMPAFADEEAEMEDEEEVLDGYAIAANFYFLREHFYDMYSVILPEDDEEEEETQHYTAYHEINYTVDPSTLPSKFDQRDVNGVCRVPEIRFQNPYGLCWAFALTAATEINYAFIHDIDYNTATDEEKAAGDFSEKAIALYTSSSLPSSISLSQEGEGWFWINEYTRLVDAGETDLEKLNTARFNSGSPYQAVPYYTSYMTPVLEADAPYISTEGYYEVTLKEIELADDPDSEKGYKIADGCDKKGKVVFESKTVTYDEYLELRDKAEKEYLGKYSVFSMDYNGAGKYYNLRITKSSEGNWEIPDDLNSVGLEVSNYNMFPAPSAFDENGDYYLDTNAVNIIKDELVSGHGVVVTLYAQQRYPDDPVDTSFTAFSDENGNRVTDMKAPVWATYSYYPSKDNPLYSLKDEITANHAVTIVGYDDNFPKEYFNDPEGRIGGDGAFIVRNSWGSWENSDVSASDPWGNNGDGYFYLSYYDETMNDIFTIDMRPEEDESDGAVGKVVNKYDYSGVWQYYFLPCDPEDNVRMANVFTAECNQEVYNVGIYAPMSNLSFHADVYLLNEDYESPTDGELVGSTDIDHPSVGYHEADLDKPFLIKKGQSYSVVVRCYSDDYKCDIFLISSALNKQGADFYTNMFLENNPNADDKQKRLNLPYFFVCGKVNMGESYILIANDSMDLREALDWANSEIEENFDNNGVDFDNFPIQTYAWQELITLVNEINEPDEIYRPGDVVSGEISLCNNTGIVMKNVKIDSTFGGLVEDGVIDSLIPGEVVSIPYKYIVSPKDAEAEIITNKASVSVDGVPIKLFEGLSIPDASATVMPAKEVAAVPSVKQVELSHPEYLTASNGSSSSGSGSAPAAAASSENTDAAAAPAPAAENTSAAPVPAAVASTAPIAATGGEAPTPAAAAESTDSAAAASTDKANAAAAPADNAGAAADSSEKADTASAPADSTDTASSGETTDNAQVENAGASTMSSDDIIHTGAPGTGSAAASPIMLAIATISIVVLCRRKDHNR